MLIKRPHMNRRTLLRGFGTTLALPLLEAMVPSSGFAAESGKLKRFQVFYTPNGVIVPNYVPKTVGENFELSRILAPLEPYRDRITLITGLGNNQPNPGVGGGGHGSACALWLTGVYPKVTEGFDISAGTSVDQLIAQKIGHDSPLGSLEVGIESASMAGACDTGFSCAYTNTLSWRSPTSPLPVTDNPREVFERLFGDGDSFDAATRKAQVERQGSLLDFVMEDYGRMAGQVGVSDKRKIDEYLASVRDVERRIQLSANQTGPSITVQRPTAEPTLFQDQARLMIDLQVVAMQADLTKVSSFMLGREVSIRSYPEIGVSDAHHYISHHGNQPSKMEDVTKINVHHVEQFAYYLKRMSETKDGEGSLLDSTLVLQGAAMGDPNGHDRANIAAVTVNLAKGNRHIAVPKGTPFANLHVSILHAMGVEDERFGDSTGPLKELSV